MSSGQVAVSRLRLVALALCLALAAGCAGPRVVMVPAADAPVRAGPKMSGRVYVWNGKVWELSRNRATIPEGYYIWDSGEARPAPAGGK